MAEHAPGHPGAQHLDVIDAVATGEQTMHHREDLAAGVRGAGTIAEIDQLVGGLLQAEPLGERRWEQQPRAGDRVLVIEHDIDLVQHHVGGSHRKGAS